MPERRCPGTGENVTRSGLTADWEMRRRKSPALPVTTRRPISELTVVNVIVFRLTLETPISSGPKNGGAAHYLRLFATLDYRECGRTGIPRPI